MRQKREDPKYIPNPLTIHRMKPELVHAQQLKMKFTDGFPISKQIVQPIVLPNRKSLSTGNARGYHKVPDNDSSGQSQLQTERSDEGADKSSSQHSTALRHKKSKHQTRTDFVGRLNSFNSHCAFLGRCMPVLCKC